MDRDFHRRGGQVVNIFHHYIYLHFVFKLYDHVNSLNFKANLDQCPLYSSFTIYEVVNKYLGGQVMACCCIIKPRLSLHR